MKVTVVIPAYNEEQVIGECLESLQKQSYKDLEIILVDDGSTDKTIEIVSSIPSRLRVNKYQVSRMLVLKQNHLGPGPARNLGASKARGEILVFVDSDMTFDQDFIKDLVSPILEGKTIGTFSKNEMNANQNNIWSKCWNINRNWPPDRLIPPDYPDNAPVYRAILKEEFDKVGGFDATGEYTDDWSLSRKLGKKSTLASGATYFHSNPSNLSEVWKQARWIGKNEFISGSTIRRIRSLIFYSFPMSLAVGFLKSAINRQPNFILFKIWFDLAVWISTAKSFFGERKSK